MNKQPKFIVFEGIDGAGKTTQINLLRASLEERGIICKTTAEPTDMPSGKEIRAALAGKIGKTPIEMAEMFSWATMDRLYDRVRNYITKKPYSKEKVKLTFNLGDFFSGWAQDFTSKGTHVIRRGEEYFLTLAKALMPLLRGTVPKRSRASLVSPLTRIAPFSTFSFPG